MGLMFGSYLISVSFALQLLYGIKDMSQLMSKISIVESILLILLTFGYFVFILLRPAFFNEFTSSFKKDRISSKFYNIMAVERLLVGSGLVFLMSVKFKGALPLTVFVILAAFILLRKPYVQSHHNYRQIANYLIAVVIEGIFLAYSFASDETKNSKIFTYLPLFVCVLLIVSVGINGLAIIYSIYESCFKKNQNI